MNINKKTFVPLASLVGILSLFMPWFQLKAFGASISINSLNGDFKYGYFFGILFIVILVISLWDQAQEKLGNKKDIAISAVSILILLLLIIGLLNNRVLFTYGVSLGIGCYLCILASVFIFICTLLSFKQNNDNINIQFDKDKVVEGAKIGADAAKAFAKVVGKAVKNSIDEVKKEMDKDKENKKEDSENKE